MGNIFTKFFQPRSSWNAEKLQWLRKNSKLTHRGLSAATGIPAAKLKAYEAGRAPALDVIVRLSDFFHIPADFLLGRMTAEEEEKALQKLSDTRKAPAGRTRAAGLRNIHQSQKR